MAPIVMLLAVTRAGMNMSRKANALLVMSFVVSAAQNGHMVRTESSTDHAGMIQGFWCGRPSCRVRGSNVVVLLFTCLILVHGREGPIRITRNPLWCRRDYLGIRERWRGVPRDGASRP